MSQATLIRYFDLAGAVDADPTTQPAPDVLGQLVTGFGGAIRIDAFVVDANGDTQDPAGLTVDIAVCWVTNVDVERVPPTATSNAQSPWSRGPIAIGKTPGVALIQAELEDVVGFQVAVLAKSGSPAGLRLAIYATRGPRA